MMTDIVIWRSRPQMESDRQEIKRIRELVSVSAQSSHETSQASSPTHLAASKTDVPAHKQHQIHEDEGPLTDCCDIKRGKEKTDLGSSLGSRAHAQPEDSSSSQQQQESGNGCTSHVKLSEKTRADMERKQALPMSSSVSGAKDLGARPKTSYTENRDPKRFQENQGESFQTRQHLHQQPTDKYHSTQLSTRQTTTVPHSELDESLQGVTRTLMELLSTKAKMQPEISISEVLKKQVCTATKTRQKISEDLKRGTATKTRQEISEDLIRRVDIAAKARQEISEDLIRWVDITAKARQEISEDLIRQVDITAKARQEISEDLIRRVDITAKARQEISKDLKRDTTPKDRQEVSKDLKRGTATKAMQEVNEDLMRWVAKARQESRERQSGVMSRVEKARNHEVQREASLSKGGNEFKQKCNKELNTQQMVNNRAETASSSFRLQCNEEVTQQTMESKTEIVTPSQNKGEMSENKEDITARKQHVMETASQQSMDENKKGIKVKTEYPVKYGEQHVSDSRLDKEVKSQHSKKYSATINTNQSKEFDEQKCSSTSVQQQDTNHCKTESEAGQGNTKAKVATQQKTLKKDTFIKQEHTKRDMPQRKKSHHMDENNPKQTFSKNGSVQNKMSRSTSMQDMSSVHHSAKGGSAQLEKTEQKRDMSLKRKQNKGNIPQQTEAEHHEDSQSQGNTVYIRIHDIITDMAVLGQVLTAKVDVDGLVLTPTGTSIKHKDGCTYCSLTCNSKANAKKLRDLLLKNRQHFTPRIDCRYTCYLEDQELADEPGHKAKLEKRAQLTKELLMKEVQCEMKTMSERALLQHNEKIAEVEKKIDTAKSQLHDLYKLRATRAEIAALESKLEELCKQKAEFNTAIEGFRAKFVTLFDNTDYEVEVKAVRKQLGVECCRLGKALPMYARRSDIVHLVQNHRVSILLAETGSGKSTQVVQYLLEEGFAETGTIVCTQPRKVAAVSLATHVAQELATNLGQTVGHKAALRAEMSPSTKVLYMTDHALLNECLKDPNLDKFSCIVVDEAHERSLYTDLLLTMIKRCLGRRPDLKVIITSATIDPQVFVQFFGTCPILRVSGRAFPVDVVWQDSVSEENEFEEYVEAAVRKVVEIHRKEPAGDILVFLTSATEIQKSCDMTQQRLKDVTNFTCLPLHGQLPPDEQQKVFKPLERNKRKIVFATNCAETSITIDGIKYVVDTGVAKEMHYNAKKGTNSLIVTTISQSSAEQRKGRAGRTAPGKCYRLYSHRSFQTMDTISLPEILKIHLGQALLKLAEFDFTPEMYDFVQSPPKDAIEAALKTLHQLGAMHDNCITDTGRWIVKLPFEPKLGLMIWNGFQNGLLYDVIVLASLMSTGSGLFYRGTSEKDRQKLDKSKMKFSHQAGDALTSLEVYKAWLAMDDRQRNKWCMANSVNSKSIRGARDSINEVIQLLKKEGKVEVTEKFSDAQETPDKLRKIIFQCSATNLCHYLGHDKAGYFAAQASRQVHFHPSSSMQCLASHPQWVVYDQLLKTSRNFITGITPVDDSWLEEISREQYGFDVVQVRQKKLYNVFTQPAGSHAYFAMVGPRYSKLRQYEDLYSSDDSSSHIVMVEANRDAGEVKVYTTGTVESVGTLTEQLTKDVDEAIREVQEEVRELIVGSEESGLRILLGQGGQLTDILLPQETRKIFITRPSENATTELIREKFQHFGEICYIHQFPNGRNWGFVVFKTSAQAEQAAKETEQDEDNVAQLERRRSTTNHTEFKAKLFLCRRPCNGTGFVEVSPAYMPQCLMEKSFYIGEDLVKIQVNKKSPDDSLYLRGLPADASEDIVKRGLLHCIGCRENSEGIIKNVTVVRENVGVTSKKELRSLEEKLKSKFQKRLRISTVQVKVFEPREKTVRFAAEARFSDPIEGYDACRALKRRLVHNDIPVDIEAIVSATLRIQCPVYEVCKDELDWLEKHVLDNVDVDTQKQGTSYVVRLEGDHMKSLVKARTLLNDIVKGDILDCNAAPNLLLLMTPAGRKRLKEAQGKTAAYVSLDDRRRTVTIHGSPKACTKMRQVINNYLEEVLSGTVEELSLRGGARPPGLLKGLVKKYGEDLDILREEAGLHDIMVNYRRHTVKLTGPRETLEKAKEVVEKMNDDLVAAYQQKAPEEEDGNDCVACFCPIEKNELYRLEACGHPYCKECIKHQVSVAIKSHQLPVKCCQDGCDVPLVWRDLNYLSRLGHIKLPALATSALSAYVRANRNKASFCPTANCPMAYRISHEAEAKVFQCPECSMRICTGCQAQAHDGMTCAMLRSSERERSGVEEWAKADSKNRKACPGCYSPIEKNGGCNRMICGACHTIFCWLCVQIFRNEKNCYDHLTEAHGGVFALEDILYN